MKILTAKRVPESYPMYARFKLSEPISKGYRPFSKNEDTDGVPLSILITEDDLKNAGIEGIPDEVLVDEVIISDAQTHIERLVFPIIKGPEKECMSFCSIAGEYTFLTYGGDPSTIHPYEYYLKNLAELNGYEWGGIIE